MQRPPTLPEPDVEEVDTLDHAHRVTRVVRLRFYTPIVTANA